MDILSKGRVSFCEEGGENIVQEGLILGYILLCSGYMIDIRCKLFLEKQEPLRKKRRGMNASQVVLFPHKVSVSAPI